MPGCYGGTNWPNDPQNHKIRTYWEQPGKDVWHPAFNMILLQKAVKKLVNIDNFYNFPGLYCSKARQGLRTRQKTKKFRNYNWHLSFSVQTFDFFPLSTYWRNVIKDKNCKPKYNKSVPKHNYSVFYEHICSNLPEMIMVSKAWKL